MRLGLGFIIKDLPRVLILITMLTELKIICCVVLTNTNKVLCRFIGKLYILLLTDVTFMKYTPVTLPPLLSTGWMQESI